ncbi:MAG: MnhB domain-containing protein [Bacteroidales bacterium]|jgi:multisubunit Na+/H+ antiporter MnhB subunit|nr:MnhB domain-containing protein [Bacteroidales bacterium]
MESVILHIAARHMRPLLVILSLVVLYRGHNEPGGGFIGGLMLGAAYILYAMAFGVEKTQKSIRISPVALTGIGLLLALVSGLPALMEGHLFMTGEWTTFFSGSSFELKLGTPLLFDLGVYFTVAGMLTLVMFSIMEE